MNTTQVAVETVWVCIDPFGKRVFGSEEAVRRLSQRPHHMRDLVAASDHDETLPRALVSPAFLRKVRAARAGSAEWVHAVGGVAGSDLKFHQLIVFTADGKVGSKTEYHEKSK